MIDRRRLSASVLLLACTLPVRARCVAAEILDLPSLDETRQRPLFSPTRRPPASKPVAATVEDETTGTLPSTPDIRVSGIIFGTDRRVAIVRLGETGPWERLSIGGLIDGWIVSSIEPRRVELRQEARRIVVSLPEGRR